MSGMNQGGAACLNAEMASLVSRFAALVEGCALTDGEVVALLREPLAGTPVAEDARHAGVGIRAETRMRRLIRLERLPKSLLAPGDRLAAGLRSPCGCPANQTPIACMIEHEDGLPAILAAVAGEHREAFGSC